MLINKALITAGVLVLSGSAALAQGSDLGARSVVVDTMNNQRALQEQAEYRAYRSQFETIRPGDALNPRGAMVMRVSEREAISIARMQGLSDVDTVRSSGAGWLVDGTDAYGQNLIVRVGTTGEVLDIRR